MKVINCCLRYTADRSLSVWKPYQLRVCDISFIAKNLKSVRESSNNILLVPKGCDGTVESITSLRIEEISEERI